MEPKNPMCESDQKEYGRSFQEYFKKVAEAAESASQNLNEAGTPLSLPNDSFGQWHESDEGADESK